MTWLKMQLFANKDIIYNPEKKGISNEMMSQYWEPYSGGGDNL